MTQSNKPSSRTLIAEVDQVSRRYADVVAVDQVSLNIVQGEVLAILGPNGAGKTTLINLMLGRLKADAGSVLLFGQPPRSLAARRRTGTMLQVGSVPGTIRVREHIELFSSYYPDPMPLDEVIEVCGLQGLGDRAFDALSGGQQQRLLFALSICGQPDLVFLDEPTVGMDVDARRRFWSVIRERVSQGITVVLTTHYLEEADALADRVIMLKQGQIAAEGTPDDIKSVAAGKIIRCRSTLDAAALGALPHVILVRDSGHRQELHSSEVEATLRALLEADQTVSDLTVSGVGLEDVFLNLTSEQSATTEQEIAS